MFRPSTCLALVLGLFFLAEAKSKTASAYFPDTAVDLVKLLAPPFDTSAPANKTELAELLQLQQSRTAAQVAAAQADQDISVFRFADVLDTAKWKPSALPITARFFAKITTSGQGPSEIAKQTFARPRPFAVDSTLHPVLGHPKNASYPSGHSLGGNLIAIVLADMVPEKRVAIFRRGWAFARQRAIGGVHYPSDLEAGRIAAALIAQRLYQEPRFRKDLEESRAEVRRVLGLAP
jgi:acid phosphatase (class A)